MKKRVIIDNRMRKLEKEQLKKLGYELIEINTSTKVYPEISSHVDIFVCKVRDKIIIEPTQCQNIMPYVKNSIKGQDEIQKKYPDDIKYNVCPIGIIICKNKNRTVVEYALNDSDKTIGVATYKIRDTLPEQMKDLLPSPEEIKKRLEGLK